MQKFCITSGVPLSMKFEPNLIFRTPRDVNSLRSNPRFPTVFCAKAFSTLCDEVFTMEAKEITRMLFITAQIPSKGKIANPGSAISP